MKSASKEVLVVSTALGVVALGTGVSLAATQGGNQSVTCIVLADAKAAVDANSALSDHFAVGTKLHLTSAGRTVDVTVSGPITAAAPPTSASAPPGDNGGGNGGANASASASAGASAPSGQGGGRKHRHHRTAAPATTTKPATAAKAAPVAKADTSTSNGGVNPNSVCVQLSKNAFNTLGNVGNGNNVGAFIATMTPVADAKQ